jgi:hypothetical protein
VNKTTRHSVYEQQDDCCPLFAGHEDLSAMYDEQEDQSLSMQNRGTDPLCMLNW